MGDYVSISLGTDRPRTKRSTYKITERGTKVLQQQPTRVDLKVLGQFDEFHEFRSKQSDSTEATPSPASSTPEVPSETPEEQIVNASRTLRQALVADLVDRIWEQSWDDFEQLVLDVLHAIGYGGGRPDAGTRLGQSGDEGVDGVIREDELGLDLIYVQAKHWKNPVGRPETRSSSEPFTESARRRASSSPLRPSPAKQRPMRKE
jgi:restriction system protein